MCGIAGILRHGPPGDDSRAVQEMLRRLEPRGPDGEGTVREGPLHLGHRRLAILDLSETGRQPMASAGGRFLVSFNGEIYNFRELIRELGVDPRSLRSSSDTEILLLAWERWGEDCLPRLAGQWAFAMYDRQEERLHLVRDRFGEKPLFYHHDTKALSFASSLYALLAVPWISREIAPESLEEYLTLRYVVSPRTILREVKKVPPGCLLSVGHSGEEVRRWWSPRFKWRERTTAPGRREEAAEEFGGLLGQATRRCLVSDVPVALLLSEGIDSNSIRATLSAEEAGVPTFTYLAEDRREGGAAEAGGRMEESSPGTFSLRISYDEIARSLRAALSSLNEPVGDGSALATWLLIRKIRPRATVFLCGHGADEVTGGYRISQDRFRLEALWFLSRLPIPGVDRALLRFTNGREPGPIRRAAMARAPARIAPAVARYLIHRPLPFPALEALAGRRCDPEAYLAAVDRLYGECGRSAAGLDRIQEVLLATFLSENILSFADSVAMASSAELRMPYLDRDLVEFVLALPPSMRVSPWPGRANTKRILRWWGARHLPAEVLQRGKKSFRFGSIRALLRTRESGVRELLLESPLLRRHLGGVASWLEEPAGLPRGTWGATTWSLASLAAWAEHAGVA
jgi:asparagine synthase (glutamine-hydrolysing)